MVLEGNGLRASHLIIESVTHRTEDAAVFPDTKYTQGIEEARYLTSLVREGHRASLSLLPNAQMLSRSSSHRRLTLIIAKRSEMRSNAALKRCVRAQVTKTGIEFDKLIPVILD